MRRSTGETAAVRPRRIAWGAAAWIAILLSIGAVQVVREQWFDAAVFFGVVAILLLDMLADLGPVAPARRPRASLRVAAPVLVAVGIAAILLPRHGASMQGLLCGAGLLTLAFAWSQRAAVGAPWAPGQRRLAWTWALIVIAGCLWELGEFVVGELRPQQPTFALSALLDPLLSLAIGKAGFISVWIAGGLFLISRARR